VRRLERGASAGDAGEHVPVHGLGEWYGPGGDADAGDDGRGDAGEQLHGDARGGARDDACGHDAGRGHSDHHARRVDGEHHPHEDDEEGVEEGGRRRRGSSELRRGHLLGGSEEVGGAPVHMAPAYPSPSLAPSSGVGLGLRWEFLDELLARLPSSIDFLEISPENYVRRGGFFPDALGRLRARYPILTHGLTMSLGGTDPLDEPYLRELAGFVAEIGSPWHSDHLCFGAAGGRVLHDLLPIAFTEAAVARVADRVKRARDVLGKPFAIENISYYLHPGRGQMGEAEFIARVCDAADCGLMLDVNNAYVNATNFGFDVDAWMRTAPLERTVQIHVAGHEWFGVDAGGLKGPAAPEADGAMIVDTHGADVPDPVLALLGRVLPRTGPVPIVLERDQNVPALDGLLQEMGRIRDVAPGGERA
jgi:uncharacterized protein